MPEELVKQIKQKIKSSTEFSSVKPLLDNFRSRYPMSLIYNYYMWETILKKGLDYIYTIPQDVLIDAVNSKFTSYKALEEVGYRIGSNSSSIISAIDNKKLRWLLAPWSKNNDGKKDCSSLLSKLPNNVLNQLTENPSQYMSVLEGYFSLHNRNYPNPPTWISSTSTTIVPDSNLKELGWCKGIRLCLAGINEDDSFLLVDPKRLKIAAQLNSDDNIKLLEIIVSDANRNDVEIYKWMIPDWLLEACKESLISNGCLLSADTPDKICVTTYSSFFSNEQSHTSINIESIHQPFKERGKAELKKVILNKSLAIDIESDGDNVFELGYASTSACENLQALNNTQNSLSEIEKKLHRPGFLIGHNIIGWDIPVLRYYKNECFKSSIIWDTLLISFILEPWLDSHALINTENAHSASSDAKAALTLFDRQFESIFRGADDLLQAAAEKLSLFDVFKNRRLISQISARKYPERPIWFDNLNIGPQYLTVVPDWRLRECFWVPGIKFIWSQSCSDEDNKLIDPQKLADIGQHSKDPYIQLLNLVVSDARQNNVQVLFGMLPKWLKTKVAATIKNCLHYSHSDGNENFDVNITTYLSLQDFHELFASYTNQPFKFEARFDFLKKTAHVSETDSSLSIQPTDPLMLFKSIKPDSCGWVIYDPANRQQESGPFAKWEYSPPKIIGDTLTPPLHQTNSPIHFLQWVNHSNNNQKTYKDFIYPTSANRPAYWLDTISRLLSLENDQSFSGVYVLLVNHWHEKDAIANALTLPELSKVLPFENNVLRHLEHTIKKQKRIAVSEISSASLWIDAAEHLGCDIRFVVEMLPLHEWRICLDSDQLESSETDADFETDETVDEADQAAVNEMIQNEKTSPRSSSKLSKYELVEISQSDIENAIESCLDQWVYSLLKRRTIHCQIIILDSRLDRIKSARFTRKEIELFSIPPHCEQSLQYSLKSSLNYIQSEPPPTEYDEYREFLKKNWGYDDFREGTQKPAVEAIIPNDSDVLVRLPTGEGKSVLFQIPALVRGMKTQRMTIVLTPLRALMADQVRTLWSKGFVQSVDYLSGDRDPWANSEVYQGIIDNRLKLLFVAPERFRVPRFRDALQRRMDNDRSFEGNKPLEYIVIDEAHCISQWGFEFRPDYLYAMSALRSMCRTPDSFCNILLFSATVTQMVEKELLIESGVLDDRPFKVRPENMLHPIQNFIKVHTESVDSSGYNKNINPDRLGFIQKIIRDVDTNNSTVILFVTRRKHAEELDRALLDSIKDGSLPDKIKTGHFHAGLSTGERIEVYEAYQAGRVNVLACTKAFGMGMDIPHIHYCIHLTPPSYLEDYLQEVGRTGRGHKERIKAGKEFVDCYLIYSKSDFENNLTKIMESRVTAPVLENLWREIRSESKFIPQLNETLCFPPVKRFSGLDADMLRRALFWLERLNKIELVGYVNDQLQIIIHRSKLEAVATENSDEARLAQGILKILNPSPILDSVISTVTTVVASIAGFLDKMIGFIFGNRETPVPETAVNNNEQVAEPDSVTVQLQIQNLWRESNLKSIDDIYRCLKNLHEIDAISLELAEPVTFEKRLNWNDRDIIVKHLKETVKWLLIDTEGRDRRITPDDYQAFTERWRDSSDDETFGYEKLQITESRLLKVAVYLCSCSAMRIRESYDTEKKLTYSYQLNSNQIPNLRFRTNQIIATANKITVKISENSSQTAVSEKSNERLTFDELLECFDNYQQLLKALRMLSNLSICAADQDLFPRSYVLRVIKQDEISEQDGHVLTELDNCNEQARLRAHAMELYALLPEEKRNEFIDQYFSVSEPEELESLMSMTIGLVEEGHINSNYFIELLARIRQDSINKELSVLTEEQRSVCEARYDAKLLVNAGPGAGKTKVLMMRCAHLINKQNIKPEEILVLAFNRAVVHEIKERIYNLFVGLGYGSYVRRLRVSTFHAFALKEIRQEDGADDDELIDILKSFADKLRDDSEFRSKVAGRYKAILVDEFQDMNDSFYTIISALCLGSGAGIMAIGDDDQDILLWNRNINREALFHGVEYINKFINDFSPEQKFLTVNFRSVPEVVESSQRFISDNYRASRLKSNILLNSANDVRQTGSINDQADLNTFIELLPDILNQGRDVAILCRTNKEVYEVEVQVRRSGIPLNQICIKGKYDIRTASRKSINEWITICKGFEDTVLTEELFGILIEKYRNIGLPDGSDGSDIKKLWDLTAHENKSSMLSDHIEFLNDLRTEDLDRIEGKQSKEKKVTISTIHKVKGLEFDTVFIQPSPSKFDPADRIEDFASDETRLFYVAMTRAKNYLYYRLAEREDAWLQRQRYSGNGYAAAPKDPFKNIFISWPGLTEHYKIKQDYLLRRVKTGDRILNRNRCLIHEAGGVQIGKLSSTSDLLPFSNLVVIDVVKSSAGKRLKMKSRAFFDMIAPELKNDNDELHGQGWLYTVLVESHQDD